MATKPRVEPRLQRMASAFGPEWLVAQRWYRTKIRRPTSVELFDIVAIPGTAGCLLVMAAIDADTTAHYLLPAVVDRDAFREPRDGEGVWRSLAHLMAAGGRLDGRRGRFSFRAAPGLAGLMPASAGEHGLDERRLGVEQSNTSVALGHRLILKCYLLLTPGTNPEVEVNAFLTAVGFVGAPRLGGFADYVVESDKPAAAAMLQELVASETDGWAWVQACLAGGAAGRDRATDGLRGVGTLTRELHLALASRPDDPAFPARMASARELAAWHARAELQLETALGALADAPRGRLLAIAAGIRRRLAALRTAGDTRVTRIHGDYHLGQLLRTDAGFSVIDFEGEPARPLAERREPASPLRDVAGMLRSIDYAASVAWRESRLTGLDTWAHGAREAFLSAYGRISLSEADLLGALEVEKACYEVAYEANNRPDWVSVPMAALERLTGASA